MFQKLFNKGRAATLLFILSLSSCSFVNHTSAFPIPRQPKPNLFRGVFHVHSEYSHDSKASLNLITKTARKAGLDFVVITDHNNMKAAGAYQKTNPSNEPLLIFGTEISTWHDGHLIGLGIKNQPPDIENAQELVNMIRKEGGYAIFAHPLSKRKPWLNWKIQNYDGFEVFCFSDIFYAKGFKGLAAKALFLAPEAFLKSVLKTPKAGLQLWDEKLLSGQRVTTFGATDAHIKWQWHDLTFENLLLYFQSVTMYVLADELKEEKIIEALGKGKSFIAFEVYGLAQDFSFSASAENQKWGPGDTLTIETPVLLSIVAPENAEIHLIHNGKILEQKEGKGLKRKVEEAGYYRAEVYREGELWIVSNPIYIET